MTKKILVADDNGDAAEVAAELLRLRGYEVFIALDGSEALAFAYRQRPDMMILDINMPRMDGYEVASALWADPPSETMPWLIALTARTQPSDVARARQAGFDLHMAKPAANFVEVVDSFFSAAE
jgi:CheY-like chemotaxis protein